MDLVKVAAQLFMQQLSNKNLDLGSVTSALTQLLPTQGGNLDVAALVAMFTQNGGGLASMAQSWLGDGGNDKLDIGSILSMFGESKVSGFAAQLGVGTNEAAGGLADMIPQLIDSASENGNLVQDVGKKLMGSALSRFF